MGHGCRRVAAEDEHPLFGKLEATLINKDGSYFWETPEPLITPKGRIGVFMDAPESGPTDDQVALWHWIYENVDSLTNLAQPLMLERLRDFQLEGRIPDLAWSAVGLSRDGDTKSPWDISFQPKGEESPILTAYFVNEVPTTVSFDD